MGIFELVTPGRRPRISVLHWILPVILGFLAVLYEVGPGRWIHDDYSVATYFDLDIVFYGLFVPLLTFAVLTLLNRWLEREKEAERKTRVSERWLASIVTASADAIIGLDAFGERRIVESRGGNAVRVKRRSGARTQVGRTFW